MGSWVLLSLGKGILERGELLSRMVILHCGVRRLRCCSIREGRACRGVRDKISPAAGQHSVIGEIEKHGNKNSSH